MYVYSRCKICNYWILEFAYLNVRELYAILLHITRVYTVKVKASEYATWLFMKERGIESVSSYQYV